LHFQFRLILQRPEDNICSFSFSVFCLLSLVMYITCVYRLEYFKFFFIKLTFFLIKKLKPYISSIWYIHFCSVLKSQNLSGTLPSELVRLRYLQEMYVILNLILKMHLFATIIIYLFDYFTWNVAVTSPETTLMVQFLHNGAPWSLLTCTLSLLLSFISFDSFFPVSLLLWKMVKCIFFYVLSKDNYKYK